jgi:RimJ/RimL family protein N-acetyltransferase
MKILETPRLILRHQILSDLNDLFALYCDPDIVKYIPDAPRNYADTRKELEWHMNGHPKHPELGLWATIHKETGKYIGRCGLLPLTIDGQDEVEAAFLISKAYWGQGLGTEAAQALLDYGFEKLNLPRLICTIDKNNLPSIKVAEKIGMEFEKEGEDEKGSFLIYSINKPITLKKM